MPALTSCGGDPVGPDDELSVEMLSANFTYHLSPGDAVDTVFQERHFAWAMGKLRLSTSSPLVYHKYRDRDHLERMTGERTNGFAEPGTYRFHTIWPADNHEYIHAVFTTHVGTPPALFNEGVAVAHHGASIQGDFEGDPLWNGSPAHNQVRQLVAAGALPDLSELVETNGFWQLDQDMTYAIAGSFVRFLLDERGVEAFKQFAALSDDGDDQRRIEEVFESTYGERLRDWWLQWLQFLDDG